jgi:hypothetical protein
LLGLASKEGNPLFHEKAFSVHHDHDDKDLAGNNFPIPLHPPGTSAGAKRQKRKLFVSKSLDAVRAVHGLLNTGHWEVVDADLSGYFDSIPRAELMQCVAGRVSDSRAYRAVDRSVTSRLRRWLCKKHKVPGAGTSRFPDAYLYQQLGLIRLPTLTRNLPWAKA